MRRRSPKGLKLVLLLLIFDVQAERAYGQENCSNMLYAGERPTLAGEFGHGTPLCNTAYEATDSPVTKAPTWSAEYNV